MKTATVTALKPIQQKRLPTLERVELALREAQAFVNESRHSDPYNSQVGRKLDPWSRRDNRL